MNVIVATNLFLLGYYESWYFKEIIQFIGTKINVTSLKNLESKRTILKCWAEWLKKPGADSNFIGISVCGSQYTR